MHDLQNEAYLRKAQMFSKSQTLKKMNQGKGQQTIFCTHCIGSKLFIQVQNIHIPNKIKKFEKINNLISEFQIQPHVLIKKAKAKAL